MIAAQNLLVIGSLVGLVVLAVLWAARFNSVKFEEEEMQDEELELADDEVQDEDGLIFRPGQMPRRGDL